jgi:hypothetical protein
MEVKKADLQKEKYKYIWTRASVDGKYAGILDRIKVDKNEGYEVLYLIEQIVNKLSLKTKEDVHKIEDILHASALSRIVMRKDLIKLIVGLVNKASPNPIPKNNNE